MNRFTVAASTLRALERMGLVICRSELGTGRLYAEPVARVTIDLTEEQIIEMIAEKFGATVADVELTIKARGGFDFVSATVRNAVKS
jgi:DNA-binding transcriptional ArsR family regulator